MYVFMYACGAVLCVFVRVCVSRRVYARLLESVCVYVCMYVHLCTDVWTWRIVHASKSPYVYGRSDAYMTYTSYVYVCMYGQRCVNFGYPRCCFGGWPWCHGSPWSPGCRGQPAAGLFMPAKPHMVYFLENIPMCVCAQSHDFGDARCGLGIGI